jgi:hypothetical protein
MATTISRTWYDTLVDDDGTGTTGSIWDKADVDSILDAIDALIAADIWFGGKVGIGSSPVTPLHITTGSGQDAEIRAQTPNGSQNAKLTLLANGNQEWRIWTDRANNILLIGTIGGSWRTINGTTGLSTFTSTAGNPAWAFNSTAANGGTILVQRSSLSIIAIGTAESLEGGTGNSNGGLWAASWPTTASAANAFLADNAVMKRSTSARRYKDHIREYRAGLSAVLQLRPVVFTEKGKPENGDHVGFIAEDVALMLPRHVTYAPNGEPDYVQYDRLTAPIVNAIQELAARLDRLERAA